jgi:hypothetical protein
MTCREHLQRSTPDAQGVHPAISSSLPYHMGGGISAPLGGGSIDLAPPSNETGRLQGPPLERNRFLIQRTYVASIDEAWVLWTTKSGIESWWGPEGFDVTVTSLDLRPGGDLIYLMTAVAPEQVAFVSGRACR